VTRTTVTEVVPKADVEVKTQASFETNLTATSKQLVEGTSDFSLGLKSDAEVATMTGVTNNTSEGKGTASGFILNGINIQPSTKAELETSSNAGTVNKSSEKVITSPVLENFSNVSRLDSKQDSEISIEVILDHKKDPEAKGLDNNDLNHNLSESALFDSPDILVIPINLFIEDTSQITELNSNQSLEFNLKVHFEGAMTNVTVTQSPAGILPLQSNINNNVTGANVNTNLYVNTELSIDRDELKNLLKEASHKNKSSNIIIPMNLLLKNIESVPSSDDLSLTIDIKVTLNKIDSEGLQKETTVTESSEDVVYLNISNKNLNLANVPSWAANSSLFRDRIGLALSSGIINQNQYMNKTKNYPKAKVIFPVYVRRSHKMYSLKNESKANEKPENFPKIGTKYKASQINGSAEEAPQTAQVEEERSKKTSMWEESEAWRILKRRKSQVKLKAAKSKKAKNTKDVHNKAIIKIRAQITKRESAFQKPRWNKQIYTPSSPENQVRNTENASKTNEKKFKVPLASEKQAKKLLTRR
jgi:hypothetical protein